MNLLARSHTRTTAILLLLGILVVGGVLAALRMPAAIFPEVTFPIVKVIADAGDQPAARMIPTVTRPLERAVDRVPGIRRVLSTTSRGSVEMSAQFRWGIDMQVALQRVQGEVQRIRPDLPPDTRIDVEWMNTSVFPILGYALSSDQVPLWKLREWAEYTLRPALIRVPGVSRVEIQGGRQREFQVHLDLAALSGRQLTPNDVVSAIRDNNQVLSAGLVESNHELYLSLVDGRTRDLEALRDLWIPVPNGVPVRLGDLGDVAANDAVSYVRTNADGREAVLVNIVQQPSANTVEIARGITKLLADQPDLIPEHASFTTFYDQASFITASVHGVRDAVLIGVALAALVLLVGLRSGKLALIAVSTIPLTVALVLLGLAAVGQTINLMSLGGIAAALGLVADDAIVVVEHIHRYREEKNPGHPILRGTADLLPALIGSSLSTIIVFLPFASLSGIAGAFFRPLALTMVLALTASFLLAAFVVPIGLRIFDRSLTAPQLEDEEEEVSVRRKRGWLFPGYVGALLLLALLVAGYAELKRLETDFLPAMDEGSIILDYWSPPGTSLNDTDQMLRQAENVIQSLPDVASYSRRTGTQLGFFITEPNRGDYVIKLKPRSQRRPVEEVISDLRKRIAVVEPGLTTDFGQLLEDNIGDLTGGSPQPIDIKIFGEDQAQLETKAKQAAQIIDSVQGVEDVFNGITIAGPALDLRTRSGALARYGLTTTSLQEAVESSQVGTVAGDIRLGERVYDIRVFGGKKQDPRSMQILTAGGRLVPLTDLAQAHTGNPEAEIDRDNLKTYLGVTARLSGRSLGGAVAEIRHKLRQQLHLPDTMSIHYGGLFEQQQTSFKGLLGVLAAGFLLVAVVLLFEFADWRAPLLTVLAALAVLSGCFGALLLSGMTLNISSFVGAIMMLGIVGENAVFVIHEARLALLRGVAPHEAWRYAARQRTRPVIMTILASAFALAPLAIAWGEGSQLLQPLAVAVIGGFVLSGPLVLVILPSLYAWIDPHGKLGSHQREFPAIEG